MVFLMALPSSSFFIELSGLSGDSYSCRISVALSPLWFGKFRMTLALPSLDFFVTKSVDRLQLSRSLLCPVLYRSPSLPAHPPAYMPTRSELCLCSRPPDFFLSSDDPLILTPAILTTTRLDSTAPCFFPLSCLSSLPPSIIRRYHVTYVNHARTPQKCFFSLSFPFLFFFLYE
ncbi:hypothetical protein BJV74DRAFT_138996 [Russula compacta]|nr:hypothetical protein BJV74DRAFT_138996 [Russula compacta]